jgi:hypothetical protein
MEKLHAKSLMTKALMTNASMIATRPIKGHRHGQGIDDSESGNRLSLAWPEVGGSLIRIQHRHCLACAFAALLAVAPAAARTAEMRHAEVAAPVSSAAMAQYQRALAEYQAAQAAYGTEAESYWGLITQKRRERIAKRNNGQPLALEDYVLTQPPVYNGPPKPVDPSQPPEEKPKSSRPYVPVVADFLAAAKQEFKFVPRQPQSEGEFKRAYAEVALAAGLRREQIVRIYSFEAGGNGGFDVQAGLEHDKSARAITTALGYNQLLATNSVEVVAESGPHFVKALSARAATLPGPEKAALERKIAVLREMISFARSVPDAWNDHQTLAGTSKGLAIHALNLDVDIGPYLQTQKLMDSIVFARRKGFPETLTAAELEMMNLTGDGNGFDMITMPREWRDRVPTANFFQRGGYRDNPVAQRNNVVARLIAATDAHMDREIRLPGSRELAAALQ